MYRRGLGAQGVGFLGVCGAEGDEKESSLEAAAASVRGSQHFKRPESPERRLPQLVCD